MKYSKEELIFIFEKYCKKLRITPPWDIRLEFGENKELSYGRCRKEKSFNELYEGLNNIE